MSHNTLKTTILSTIFTAFLLLPPAQAGNTTNNTEKTPPPKTTSIQKKAEKPSLNKQMQKKFADLAQKLDDKSMNHFMVMYGSYNIIESVKIVRTDVGNAIKACGENNPDIKENLTTRFKTWKNAIDPIIKKAEDNYKNMMRDQKYADKKELKDLFAFIDKTRSETNNKFKKIPVTSKEGCNYLLNKMDDSQPNLIGLLQGALPTYTDMYLTP